MENVLVDSNVLIARFNEDDSQHLKACTVFPVNAPFFVLDIVVYEAITVLLLRAHFERAQQCLEFLEETAGVTILSTSQNMQNYFDLFKKTSSSKLAFIDIAILYHSQKYKVLTFDVALQKAVKHKKI